MVPCRSTSPPNSNRLWIFVKLRYVEKRSLSFPHRGYRGCTFVRRPYLLSAIT